MKQKTTNFELFSLFKLKRFLEHQESPSFFPILEETNLETNPLPAVYPSKYCSVTLINKYSLKKIFHFVSVCKQNVFLYNFNLSRFTTMKYRVIDRRPKPVRLTEFAFNFDFDSVELPSLEKAKLSLNFFVNSFNFSKHLFMRFKRTHSARKLKPWKKTYSLLFRKISAKHFGFNSFLFSFNKSILNFFLMFKFFFHALLP